MGKVEARKAALVTAAAEQFHRNGVNGVSLADIARAADIPPGNVFYYFRTKEELARAVALDWAARVAAMLAELEEASPDPAERLRAFVARAAGRAEAYADLGCPLAGLAQDWRQQDFSEVPANPLGLLLAWLTRQFAELATPNPERSATFLLSSLQGAYLLAHANHDHDCVTLVVEALAEWLNGQAPAASAN